MWPNPQETVDLVTFTEEILNAELHFLCIDTFTSKNETWHTDMDLFSHQRVFCYISENKELNNFVQIECFLVLAAELKKLALPE